MPRVTKMPLVSVVAWVTGVKWTLVTWVPGEIGCPSALGDSSTSVLGAWVVPSTLGA